GVALAAGIWFALVLLQVGAPTLSSRWYAEALDRKTSYARAGTSPKIIVVGGSSVLFSVRAEQIERETGTRAVNMGTGAALGLPYILYTSQQVAEPGDLIVLSLEYELYGYDGEPTQSFLDQV